MKEIFMQILTIFMQVSVFYYFTLTLAKVLENKTISKKRILFAATAFLLIVILGMFLKQISPLINTLIITLITFIVFKFFISLSTIKSLLFTISLMIFFAITEIISVLAGLIIFNTTAQNFTKPNIQTFIVILFQTLISFGIIKFSKILLEKISNMKNFSSNINPKQILALIILLISCLLPELFFITLKVYNYSSTFILITSFQLIIVSFTIIIYFKRTVERDKSLSDLFTSELHNKTMVGMVDGVRTLKHDYNNIMQALNGYVATKQYDKLQEHINKVLEECNIINNLSIIDPKIFNHPAIYGIVGAKYFLATEENIIFDLDIVTNISEICFPIPELSRILGIFLDNAMEATKKCDNPYIRLEMKYDNRKCADIIKVINSYDTSINIDLSEIYKKGISSKKVKSGLGLWEVKNLVKKVNNSQVFATIENTKFVQNLIVEKI